MIIRPACYVATVALAAAVLPAAAAAPAAAATMTTLKPFDEAAKDPSFLRFRARLMKIVARRDLAALRRILHPHVLMSYGGVGNGIDGAIRTMRKEPGRWKTLARILRRGGRFTMTGSGKDRARMFFAPYTYFAELPGGIGAYDVVTVVGTRVRVHARPGLKSRVIARLSHAVVRVDWGKDASRAGKWTHIKLPDGRSGYVLARYAKSPVDFRAGFVKYKGRWTMRIFVAGD